MIFLLIPYLLFPFLSTVKRGVLRLQTMRPKLPQDVDEDKGDRRLMVYERKRKG